jgi:electron transfer flavoprotein alpha subunit
MLAAAHDLAKLTSGKVIGILLGSDAINLADDLAADLVLYGDDPKLKEFTADSYKDVLAALISEHEPKAVLLGSTTIGSDIAGSLAIRLNKPIVSSCISLSEGKVLSQICGGKILAESELADETTFITMIPGGYKPEQGKGDGSPDVNTIDISLVDQRVTISQFLEPEIGDVDITSEEILIAVGRGIQTEDNIELAEELAELLGGVICSSRPIVDQGWLPISRMVGKSGHHVKPKLYLALGISGAPEHVEGMADAEMVIAINIDPGAPIFDIAKYGAEVDMFDLIDYLIEAIEEVA